MKSHHEVAVIRLTRPYKQRISVLVTPEGALFRPLLGYLLTPRVSSTSSSNQELIVQAVRLLLDHAVETGAVDGQLSREDFLKSFSDRLPTLVKHKNQVGLTLRTIDSFLVWLSETAVENPDDPRVKLLAAPPSAGKADVKSKWLIEAKQTTRRGWANTKKKTRTPSFPESSVWRMISAGCRDTRIGSTASYERRFNVRNQIAYLLLFFGGLRLSNLMHIYTTDLKPQSDGLINVRLAHPSESQALPGTTDARTRREYLESEFGLQPRNELHKKDPNWSGWKNLLLEFGPPQYYSNVYWISPAAHRMFSNLVPLYLRQLSSVGAAHPYFFVNLTGESAGSPWKRKQAASAFRSSVERVSLRPGKRYGTHTHGARHFYGQMARRLGIDPRIRQIMMHHRSILSQNAYQVPAHGEINKAIQEAVRTMSDGANILPAQSQTEELNELTSGWSPYG